MSKSSKNRILTVAAALIVCTVMLFGMGISVLASNIIDWDNKATLKIQPQYNKANVSGGKFSVYLVAEASSVNGQLHYTTVAPFDASDVDFNDVHTALEVQAAVDKLLAYTSQVDISDVIEIAGGSSGSGLTLGVYLVVQTGQITNYTSSSPFLAFLPMINEDGTGWLYETEAYPKLGTTTPIFEPSPVPSPSPTPTPTPPPTTPPDEEEILDEDTPRDGTVITIPDEEELFEEDIPLADAPQTGLLQWPIPVFSGLGIAMIGGGAVVGRDKGKGKNEQE